MKSNEEALFLAHKLKYGYIQNRLTKLDQLMFTTMLAGISISRALTVALWLAIAWTPSTALASTQCKQAISNHSIRVLSIEQELEILSSTKIHREKLLKRNRLIETMKTGFRQFRRLIGSHTQDANGLAHPFLFIKQGIAQKAHLLAYPFYNESLDPKKGEIAREFRKYLKEFKRIGHSLDKQLQEFAWREVAYKTYAAALKSKAVKQALKTDKKVTIDIPFGRSGTTIRYRPHTFEKRSQIQEWEKRFLREHSKYFHRSPLFWGERQLSYTFLRPTLRRQAWLYRYLEVLEKELHEAELNYESQIGLGRKKLLHDTRNALNNLTLRPSILSVIMVSQESSRKEVEYYIDVKQNISDDVKALNNRISPEYRRLYSLRFERGKFSRFGAKTARIYSIRIALSLPFLLSSWFYSPTLTQVEYFVDQHLLGGIKMTKIVNQKKWNDDKPNDRKFMSSVKTYMYEKHGISVRFRDGKLLAGAFSENPYAFSDALKFQARRTKELAKQAQFEKSFNPLYSRSKLIYDYYKEMADISFSESRTDFNKSVLSFIKKHLSISLTKSQADDFLKVSLDFAGQIKTDGDTMTRIKSTHPDLVLLSSEFAHLRGEAEELYKDKESPIEMLDAKTQLIIELSGKNYGTFQSLVRWTFGL